jgi:nucleoside-diphosphate-sugar epimerase
VIGLARSDASAAKLEAAGVAVQRGDLNDLDSLRAGAKAADGVIHLAYIHDFSQMDATAKTDALAIETMGAVLEGTGAPLVIAGGVMGVAPGRVATERDEPETAAGGPPRLAGARAALALADRGVRASVVRLAPAVHDGPQGGFSMVLHMIAQAKGYAGYTGDGSARWTALHVKDAASLFRLALEKAPAGARLHGVGEEGVRIRDIAGAIGRRLDVPVRVIEPAEASDYFGFLASVVTLDSPASSVLTQELMGWRPVGPGLVEDLTA